MSTPCSLCLALLAVPVTLFFLIHVMFRAPRLKETGSPGDYGIEYEERQIPTVNRKLLYAWWLPEPGATSTLVVLHGWGSNAELMLPLALPLREAGLNILLLDARNHGRSDSDSFSSMPRFAEDAGAAVNWLKSRSGNVANRVALLGHSVGAGAVLLEASRRNDISAVISIAAFAHPEWMMRRYLDRFHVPTFLQTRVLRYVEWIIGHRYDDIAPMNTACRAGCPVLLVHGKADRTVPVSDVFAIRDSCPDQALGVLLIDGAGHDSVESIEEHVDELARFLAEASLLPSPVENFNSPSDMKV